MTSFDRLRVELVCKTCNTDQALVEHEGFTVCHQCGLCIGSRLIDNKQEWRQFEDDSYDKSRVGGFYYDGSGQPQPPLHTYIEKTPGSGALLRAQFHCTNQSKFTQMKDFLMKTSDTFFCHVHFPSLVERAVNHFIMYLTPEDIPRMHGLDETIILGVFLFQACKSFDMFRTFEVIANTVAINKVLLKSAHHLFENYLDGHVKNFRITDPITSLDGIGLKVALKLGLTKEERETLLKILHFIQESKIGEGRQAETRIALGIYLLGKNLSVAKIAEVVGITVLPVNGIISDWNALPK